MDLENYLLSTIKGELSNSANSIDEKAYHLTHLMKMNIHLFAVNYARYFHETVKSTDPSPLYADELFFDWLKNEYIGKIQMSIVGLRTYLHGLTGSTVKLYHPFDRCCLTFSENGST